MNRALRQRRQIKKTNNLLIPLASLISLIIVSTKFEFVENFLWILLISIFVSYFCARSSNLTLTILKIMTLLMATLFIPINPLIQFFISGILLFFVDKPGNEHPLQRMKSWIQKLIPSLVAVQVTYLLMKSQIVYVIQFLSFGYDNAFHLSLFRQFNISGHFPSPFSDDGWSDFTLFRSYPTGQAALYSLLSKLLFGFPKGFSAETASFFTLILVTLILAFTLGFKLVLGGKSLSRINLLVSVSFLLAGTFVYLGIFVSNGFPPYLLGSFILLIFMIQVKGENLITQAHKIGCAIFLLMLISPALLFFLIVPSLYLMKSLISEVCISRDVWCFVRIISMPFFLSFAALAYYLDTSSNLGWRQVYAGGGIQPPNLLASFLMLFTSGLMFFRIAAHIKTNTVIQTFASGTVSVALLSAITILYTGSIQYYAVKQFYVWIYLAVIFVGMGYLIKNEKSDFLKRSIFLLAASAICLSFFNSKTFTGGFMGSPRNALYETFREEAWDKQVVDARFLFRIASNLGETEGYCYILANAAGESDLNSRWINALDRDGLVTSKCFGVYWNSGLLTLDLAFERAKNSGVPIRVFVSEEQLAQLSPPPDLNGEIVRVP